MYQTLSTRVILLWVASPSIKPNRCLFAPIADADATCPVESHLSLVVCGTHMFYGTSFGTQFSDSSMTSYDLGTTTHGCLLHASPMQSICDDRLGRTINRENTSDTTGRHVSTRSKVVRLSTHRDRFILYFQAIVRRGSFALIFARAKPKSA